MNGGSAMAITFYVLADADYSVTLCAGLCRWAVST